MVGLGRDFVSLAGRNSLLKFIDHIFNQFFFIKGSCAINYYYILIMYLNIKYFFHGMVKLIKLVNDSIMLCFKLCGENQNMLECRKSYNGCNMKLSFWIVLNSAIRINKKGETRVPTSCTPHTLNSIQKHRAYNYDQGRPKRLQQGVIQSYDLILSLH